MEQANFIKQHYPEIKIILTQDSPQLLLEKIHRGEMAFALLTLDFFIIIDQKFLAKVAFDAFYPESINWLINSKIDEELISSIDYFFQESMTKK